MVINRRWLPLNALRAYEAVGRNLSFTVGAQALHVSQSALSRHVISLEELLGKPLLERRPHGLVLTEAGAALLPVVSKAFDRIEQTLNLIQQGERSARTLRVHMPPSLLHHLALPILRDFRREFPDIRIDISSTHVTGLPTHDLDVAVVYDRPSVDDRVTDLLWMVRVTPMCSPELAAREAGKSLGDFLNDNELLHVKLDSQPRDFLWTTFARQCGLSIDTDRGLAFDTAMSAVQYATSGDGVVLADIDMLAHDVADGRLTAPYPSAVFEEGYGYYLKFHPEDLADPVIALFRSWMIARFSAHTAAVGAAAVESVAD
jgi:LysR family glycine cleavage system transcriptional activator